MYRPACFRLAKPLAGDNSQTAAAAPRRFRAPVITRRFFLFAMIGGIGVVTHLATLHLAIGAFGIAFPAGQAIAATTAMTGNFLLNNAITYRSRRLRGRALVRGLFGFYGVCGIGLAGNIVLAAHLFAAACPWWLAAIGGATVSVMWNYAMSSALVWRPRAPAPMRRG
jgi:dolichol-phosphate mannosyltransferase